MTSKTLLEIDLTVLINLSYSYFVSLYFVENGEKKAGFIKIDDKTYYIKEGIRLTGAITVDGKHYFLDEEGVLKPGIVLIDGKKFFIDDEGNRHVGWKKIGLDWYYFSKEDGMKTG